MDTRSSEFYMNAWILLSSSYLLAFVVKFNFDCFEMSAECLVIR